MDWKKVEELTRHIARVQENCLLLGQRLHEIKKYELSRQIIANGQIHDNSKFRGVEWENLFSEDVEQVAIAMRHHNTTNLHHPESWAGGIKEMHPVYLGELVCDWRARSSEFGTSLTDWIEKDAKKRFRFTKRDKVYQDLYYFVNLLLEKPFDPLVEEEKKQ